MKTDNNSNIILMCDVVVAYYSVSMLGGVCQAMPASGRRGVARGWLPGIGSWIQVSYENRPGIGDP